MYLCLTPNHIKVSTELQSIVQSSTATKYMAIKCSIKSIQWNPAFMTQLQTLVLDVNQLTTHTYLFTRYIFLNELQGDLGFPLHSYINQAFFVEVFLSLVDRAEHPPTSSVTSGYRDIIRKYKSLYMRISDYTPIRRTGMRQIAFYQGKMIEASYLNNVANQFGNYFRHLVNVLLNVKEKKQQLRRRLEEQGIAEDNIKQEISRLITQPTTAFKLKVSQSPVDTSRFSAEHLAIWEIMSPILRQAYPEGYCFAKNNLYYDSKAHPENHIKAFFGVARYCEKNGLKLFQCFPLRRTWIPCNMQLDTMILMENIMGIPYAQRPADKMDVWRQAVDLRQRVFKASKDCKFRGTLYTDGVAVTVIKTNEETRAGNPRKTRSKKVADNQTYIEQMSPSKLSSMDGRCVLIDPGRRDLMYAMHEDSTAANPITFRYTKCQQRKERKTKKFELIRSSLKEDDDGVSQAEIKLSRHSSKTVCPIKYAFYCVDRGRGSPILSAHHTNTTSNGGQHYPIHRKLRLSAHINKTQADDRLAKSLHYKFGLRPALVFGNWSAPHQRYHEPIRGKGLRKALKLRGFDVCLIDEYKTSSLCPICHQGIKTFKRSANPRPFRRAEQPTVTVHGLLRCNNRTCLESMNDRRLWNRDLAAVLNFRWILRELRTNGTRPARFRRPRSPQFSVSVTANAN